MAPPEMFVEFMKEEIIKSVKLNSLSPSFLPANKGGLACCIWDNGVIISHSALPAAVRAIFTLSARSPLPTASVLSGAGSKEPPEPAFSLPTSPGPSPGLIASFPSLCFQRHLSTTVTPKRAFRGAKLAGNFCALKCDSTSGRTPEGVSSGGRQAAARGGVGPDSRRWQQPERPLTDWWADAVWRVRTMACHCLEKKGRLPRVQHA